METYVPYPVRYFFDLVPAADRADVIYFDFNGGNFINRASFVELFIHEETEYVQFNLTERSLPSLGL